MIQPRPLPERLGGDFSVETALALGATRDRLRARDLAAPFWGARSIDEPDDVWSRARALLPLLRPDQYFSHLTAAQLWGLRLPERPLPTALHLTYRFAHRSMRRPGVIGHKTIVPPRIAHVAGIPVSPAVDAWCESAPCSASTNSSRWVTASSPGVPLSPISSRCRMPCAVTRDDGVRDG